MTKVDFFSKEITYSGSIESYTKEDFFELAKARAQSCDCYDETIEMEDCYAQAFDGFYLVEHSFPCNKTVTVKWSYIREEE